jgi:2-methylaconitate cis-trans-isomerase PrpF
VAAFKGVFFNAGDLPADVRQRDALLLRVIGSPDPYRKHSDRLGGATSSTSKVVLLSKSQRAGCDVDYLFGAVAIDAPLIDWPGIGTSENRRHSADGRDRLANRKGDFIAQCA